MQTVPSNPEMMWLKRLYAGPTIVSSNITEEGGYSPLVALESKGWATRSSSHVIPGWQFDITADGREALGLAPETAIHLINPYDPYEDEDDDYDDDLDDDEL